MSATVSFNYAVTGLSTLKGNFINSYGQIVKASDGSAITNNSTNRPDASVVGTDVSVPGTYLFTMPTGAAADQYTLDIWISPTWADGEQAIGQATSLLWDGSNFSDSVIPPITDPSWDLADYQAVRDLLSAENLAIIDDPNNSGTEDLDFVQRAGDWSDAQIYGRLATFGYAIPLAGMDAYTVTLLRDVSAKLTVWQMNQSRALLSNKENAGDVVEQWKKDALSTLTSIGFGSLVITANRVSGYDATATGITGQLSSNTINRYTLANPQASGIGW